MTFPAPVSDETVNNLRHRLIVMKEILNEEDDPSDAQVKPGVNFTNMFMCSFYMQRSQKRQKTDKSSAYFYSYGIWVQKSCS